MRRILKKIIEILDGTPAVYGKRQRGQSVVELALVTPLLIILLAGLAEIGYFAQNYLNLLEVSRVGARAGTVQQGATSPITWEVNAATRAASADIPDALDEVAAYRNCDPSDTRAVIGFYNFLSCVMITSMDPMPFRDPIRYLVKDTNPVPNGIDEIVISAFAIQTVIPSELSASQRAAVDWPLDDPNLVRFGNLPSADEPQAIVVGRYPANANECDELNEREPFDWITDNTLTFNGTEPLELVALTPQGTTQDPPVDLRGADPKVGEKFRGFVWNGQHVISNTTDCKGSEWSIKRIEQMVNLQGFDLEDGTTYRPGDDLRAFVPSQGIVLVEIFWEHETLSQYVGLAPVLSPVFAILGEDVTVSVWSAFPLPTVEPRIRFS
ncbi:MAG: pilus assembly protein [Anaerolineae bacterium]|nr:pilus assembly protein [Anaerolineae bacterium]